MAGEPARPAVTAARRADALPTVQCESLTLLRRQSIAMIPDFSYIMLVPVWDGDEVMDGSDKWHLKCYPKCCFNVFNIFGEP